MVRGDETESKFLRITGVDTDPESFLASLPAGCKVFADDPETVTGYMESKTTTNMELIKLPPLKAKAIYEFALLAGGKTKAGSYENLTPLYLRSDPAHQKYPEGFNRN